jgi:hypothetical protein
MHLVLLLCVLLPAVLFRRPDLMTDARACLRCCLLPLSTAPSLFFSRWPARWRCSVQRSSSA